MSIVYKTQELLSRALDIAQQYHPIQDPLLVGSTVWLGEGSDIDVVVLCDKLHHVLGERCGHDNHLYMESGFTAYRHGVVNVIVVDDPVVFSGWQHAAHELLKGCPVEKSDRVALCKQLRSEGEALCR